MENPVTTAKRIEQVLLSVNKQRGKDIISSFHGDHDHSQCQEQAIENALKRCHDQGLKLTRLRQQVLEIVWGSHHPIGAYDVLKQLQERGHKPAPPTAYRALDFLVSAQLIHRIESLNSFIGCPSPAAGHQCQFYICKKCGYIAEDDNQGVANAVSDAAAQLGFAFQQPVIEVHGICKHCQ